ncbi:S41 family peptidase [Pseudonocardia xinjiangensis]|uniref:S41 family peptidase n=1 Tax=Pseudonocardia xinjiangensis TaxID=75289 RepID=UPI003D8B0B9E
MPPSLRATVLVVLAVVLSACAAPATGSRTTPVDGVWRTDGYSWIIAVRDGHAETLDTTSVSCLPDQTLTQLGTAGPDGTVQYGNDDQVAVETLHRTANGQGALRLLGTAADIDLVPMSALPAACTRETPDNPLTDFDIFWATFAENYNSTQRKNVDWNAIRAKYRPMVNAATTPDELYNILVDMITPLGDAHASIDGPGDRSFSGKRPGTRDGDDVSRRDATRAVDAHLRQDLGVTDIQTFADGKFAYADLPGGRGYLRITGFEGYGTDDDLFPENSAVLASALDSVFTQARVQAWKGLVIDVRWNSGGDDQLGLQVAGRLTDTPYTAYSKQARNSPDDPTAHGRLRVVTVTPGAGPRYTGPVRLLTSDLTVSAGETFTEALQGRTPAPSRVGTATQGVFADDMERKLPNGWTFTLGNEDYLASDGRNYEGVGVPPTVPTPVFTPDDLAQHRDPALDTPWPQPGEQ